MRIPLDYYRILGLPIQATADQLQQAHRDRTLQLPRREFSETAIASRRELVDEAYTALSDPARRQAYDTSFLAKSHELSARANGFSENGHDPHEPVADPPDPYTSSIEIQEHQLVGALLTLLEMGEYEMVLKLGRPYISAASPLSSTQSSNGYRSQTSLQTNFQADPYAGLPAGAMADDPADITRADITLTVALACLELGREQWQQGQYENAAEALTTGKDVLLNAGLFANIRGEIYSDLSKLRPYRVLELLALPEIHKPERDQGMALLNDMLEERGGIDGTGDDQSGLSMDDFLRFIQQLRSYLTSAEQHALFEKEARRPSAVATYLAVYALLARGFAQRQPGLIRRAKQMLTRLGNRQDVHLEQAVCALLLGQTEEANRALDMSQEFESIAFIREHSQGAPDLLPGLCLYSERWLQNEVFPHFRDLARKEASLKEYFADEDVQAYLEELPGEPDAFSALATTSPPRSLTRSETAMTEPRVSVSQNASQNANQGREYAGYIANGTSGSSSTALSTALIENPDRLSGDADRGSRTQLGGSDGDDGVVRAEAARVGFEAGRGEAVRRPRGRSPRLDRMLFLAALSLAGIVLVALLANWLMNLRSTQPSTTSAPTAGSSAASGATAGSSTAGSSASSGSAAPTVTPSVAAPTAVPATATATTLRAFSPILLSKLTPPAPTPDTSGNLTTESAQALIKNWLTVKIAATGQSYATDQLPKVLTGEALSQWQAWIEKEKAENSYLKYEHASVTVNSVQLSPDNPDQAIVEATVNEKKEVFANGKSDEGAASSGDLLIRYTLVRQNNQWLIQSIEAI